MRPGKIYKNINGSGRVPRQPGKVMIRWILNKSLRNKGNKIVEHLPDFENKIESKAVNVKKSLNSSTINDT